MPCISILLKGGLGNQIFQYAFSKYLEEKGFLISGFYENYRQDSFNRNLILNNILKDSVTCKNIDNFTGEILKSENDINILNFLGKNKYSKISYLLEGYYQKIKFLRNNFSKNITYKYPENIEILAIHVRRSDYAHHGILPISYYHQILNSLGYPKFIVYSDEINFCNYIFSKFKNYCGTVRPNLSDPSDDFLKLMSHKNIVMSNSSFSYLAGFLSYQEYHGKIFYPRTWSYLGEHPGFESEWIGLDAKLINYYS